MSAPFTLPASLAAELEALLKPPVTPRPIATDERYQLIRQEVARLESPAGGEPDWRRIADLGAALLREAAKDLLLAAYTALALARTRGLPGVHLGLLALTRLLHAPGLAPPRPQHRARALEWYLARLRPDLLALSPAPEHTDAVRALPLAVRALRTCAQDTLGDAAPSFGPVLQAAESLCAGLPEEPVREDRTNDERDTRSEAYTSSDTCAPSPASSPDSSDSSPAPPVRTSAPHDPSDSPVLAGDRDPAAPHDPSDSPSARPVPPAPPGPLDELRALAAPWLAPLAGDSPCGPDPVAHEAFAELRAEVQKLSAIATINIDWVMIEARSGELLQRHAKDLRLAAYFTLARHHRAGLTGLALGLTIAAELFDAHPAALHPRQPRARRLITEWLIGQLLTALHARRSPLPAGEFAALEAACNRLGAVLRERLGDDAPSQRPIREALQQLAPLEPETPADEAATTSSGANSASPPPSPPGSPPSPAATPSSPANPAATSSSPANPAASASSSPPASTAATSANPAPASPTSVNSPVPAAPASSTASPGSSAGPANLSPPTNAGTTTAAPIAPVVVQAAASVAAPADLAQLDRFLDATDDALVHTARSLREAQPADPRAYRLLRIGIWLRLAGPPPTRPDGNTAISGLAERDRAALDDLAARQRWLDLLHRSENLLRTHRLVLDLQRHSAAALTALGPDHAPAALALRAELCGLLLRFSTLPGLRDRDGRPLADPDTQRWLSEHVLPRSRPAAPTAAADSDLDPAFWSELPARLRGDDRDAALADAQARIDQSPSRKARFLRSLGLAEAALEAGDPRLAALLFTALAADAERQRIDQWDPPLLARCLAGAARSHHRRGQPAARDLALEQLSRLDAPTTAALLTELPGT